MERVRRTPKTSSLPLLNNLRTRLVLLVLIAVLPIFGLVLTSTLTQIEIQRAQVKENFLQLARLVAANHEQTLEGARQVLIVLASTTQVRNGDPVACNSFLTRLSTRNHNYALLGVADLEGNIFCSSMPMQRPVNISDRAYFQQAMLFNRFSVGGYQVGRITNKPSIGLAYPVYNNAGKMQSIVFATLDLSNFRNLSGVIEPEGIHDIHLTVIDPQGIILLHTPEYEEWHGRTMQDTAAFQSIDSTQEEGTFEGACIDRPDRCLYTFKRLHPSPTAGLILMNRPVRSAFAEMNQTILYQFIGMTAVLLMALGTALLFSELLLVRKIRVIAKAMDQVKNGNLGARVRLPLQADELSLLANNFDQMAEALEKRNTDLRTAENARRSVETRLGNILQNASEAILSVDEDYNIVVFNKGAERIFGYAAEEMIGCPLDTLLLKPPEASLHAFWVEPVFPEGFSATTAPTRLEIACRRKSGQVFPAEFSACHMQEDQQRLLTIFLIDNTQRQQVMNELQESRRALTSILSNLPGMVYRAHVSNGVWNMEFASQGALELTGYKADMLIDERGIQYQKLIHPDDLPRISEEIQSAVKLGETYRATYRITDATGKEKWVWEQGHHIGEDENDAAILEGFVIYVSDRHKAEEKVQHHVLRLAPLRTMHMAIAGLLDLQPILSALVDQVIIQLKVDAAAVLLFQANMFEYAAGSGFRTRGIQKMQVDLSEGFIGQAAIRREMIFCEDVHAAGPGEQISYPNLYNESFYAYAAIPLIAKSELRGVLCVFHRSPLRVGEEWRSFLEALAGQASIAIESATLYQQARRSNLELTLAYEETIVGWANALELRDVETGGHSSRVVDMTLSLARAMCIPEQEIAQIRRGAILHDIGKMGIPDSILLKKGPLTPEEMERMRQHPIYAYNLLSSIPFLRPSLDIPYCHHERWDGSGYPNGLKGEQIPLSARIFAIVDVWDALRKERPYKPAWPDTEILEYIQEQSGKMFDPQVVEAFLALLDCGAIESN